MNDVAVELKKRIEFKLTEMLQQHLSAHDQLDDEMLTQTAETTIPDALELIAKAEELGQQLGDAWEEMGRPTGNPTRWLRQHVDISLTDSPSEILEKATHYLQRRA